MTTHRPLIWSKKIMPSLPAGNVEGGDSTILSPVTYKSNQNTELAKVPQSVRETITWLQKSGYPVLPVAPKQDPSKHPKRDRLGNIEYENDGITPKALFTGKNPSYLDKSGTPRLIKHQEYHDKLPTNKELQEWFANPANGIGTLGGWRNTVWVDFDVKQFQSK